MRIDDPARVAHEREVSRVGHLGIERRIFGRLIIGDGGLGAERHFARNNIAAERAESAWIDFLSRDIDSRKRRPYRVRVDAREIEDYHELVKAAVGRVEAGREPPPPFIGEKYRNLLPEARKSRGVVRKSVIVEAEFPFKSRDDVVFLISARRDRGRVCRSPELLMIERDFCLAVFVAGVIRLVHRIISEARRVRRVAGRREDSVRHLHAQAPDPARR